MPTDTRTFIDKINQALAKGDTEYVIDHVTDDIRVKLVGSQVIEGKAAGKKLLQEVYGHGNTKRTVTTVVTQDNIAVVEGETAMTDQTGTTKTFAFCDLYRLNNSDGKINDLTSYVIELKER